MIRVFTQGTLGDSYIIACKIKNINDRVIVYHRTRHRYWWSSISDILRLPKNTVDVRFIDDERKDLIELTSDLHEQNPDFFPNFEYSNKRISIIHSLKPYTVLQPHSGKLKGGNAKYLPHDLLQRIILERRLEGDNCIVLGIHPKYSNLDKCTNLIGQTTILETIPIIRGASKFIGCEGVLSFIALSNKIRSDIYFSSYGAIVRRIIDTPWENYVDEFIRIRI